MVSAGDDIRPSGSEGGLLQLERLSLSVKTSIIFSSAPRTLQLKIVTRLTRLAVVILLYLFIYFCPRFSEARQRKTVGAQTGDLFSQQPNGLYKQLKYRIYSMRSSLTYNLLTTPIWMINTKIPYSFITDEQQNPEL